MERAIIQRGPRNGAIFGTVLIFLALFGLLTSFAENSLWGIPVPSWMVGILTIWAGYTAFGPAPQPLPGMPVASTNPTPPLVASALAGLVFSLIVVLLGWVATNLDLQSALEKLTPQVTSVLIGDGSFVAGAVRQLVQGLVLGFMGGALRLNMQRATLPPAAKEGAAAGATLLLSIYLTLVSLVILLGLITPALSEWTPADLWPVLRGVAVSLVAGGFLGVVASFVWPPEQVETLRARYAGTPVFLGALGLAALTLPLVLGSYWNQVFTTDRHLRDDGPGVKRGGWLRGTP